MSDLFKGLEDLGFNDVANLDIYNKDKEETQKKKPEAKPEDFIYTKRFNCTNCGREFENYAVRPSKIKHIKADTDLRNYFEPYDPMYYDVVICRFCGYSAITAYFGSLLEKQSELIRHSISSKFKAKEYPMIYSAEDAVERYKLSLLNSTVKQARNSEKAITCLKLAWLYRDIGDSENESSFTEHALNGFIMAYETERFPICGMDALTLAYLIGDLSRRTGKNAQALKWLGQVLTSRDVKSNLKEKAANVKTLITSVKN